MKEFNTSLPIKQLLAGVVARSRRDIRMDISRGRARYLIILALVFMGFTNGTSIPGDFAGSAVWACANSAFSSSSAVGETPTVHALFNLATPAGGPFPSDWFTVSDSDQNTGRRVALPMPSDCIANRSDCDDITLLNMLDGFNQHPRLSIPFDGPIDVGSVTSQSVLLISLGSTLPDGDSGGTVVGINQIVWDTFTNSLHVRSDEALDEHTRYALIVTSGLRDPSGAAVEASETFRRFRRTVRGHYKQALLDAIHAARRAGIREDDIIVAK